MRFTYLGLFAKIFEWVFEKILSPVVKFLASLLSAVFEWIFENIIAPILTLVLKEIIPWIIDLIVELLSFLFYEVLAYLCKIVDYMQTAFDIFAGVQPVTFERNDIKTTGPLLQAVMAQPVVVKMFAAIMAVGFVLAMVFTIIQVAKSVIDLDFEGKRPVGAVLRSLFKTAIQFIMVPLSVIIIIAFSTQLLKTIDDAVKLANGNSGSSSLGRIVFLISSLDAEKTSSYNIGSFRPSSTCGNILEAGGRKEIYTGTKSYLDSSYIKAHFNLRDFDYFTGYIAGIFLIIVLAASGLVFIQRLFDVVVLYIISPVFVATMPLDEGEKFKRWKDLFYGKVFGGYGAILSMKLYFLLLPLIMSPQLKWGESSEEGAYLLKLMFILGGAYACTKIGAMVTGLISQSAGAAEAQTSGMVSSAMGGAALSMAMSGMSWVTGKVGGAVGSMLPGFGGGESTQIADQKFSKMRPGGAGGGNKGETGDKPGSSGGGDNKADIKAKPDLKYDMTGGKAQSKTWFDKALGKVHKVFPHKSNPDGSYSFGMLGFRINYDKDGNRTGFKVPTTEFKYDKNGNSHVDNFNVPGIVKMQRRGTDGSFCVKDIPSIGLNRTQGQDGDFHTSHLGLVGYNAEEMDNGEFSKTSIMGLKFGAKLNESTGKYETNGVRVGNLIFGGEDLTKK